jgi:CDP-diacylglycerol--serine O-phosphatidyltransferase
MGDDDDSPARPRGVYWLPNLLTTGALFAGFYAIVAAIDLRFEYAGIAVFVAMTFDFLDGRVARWTNTASAFGKEYDSLSDMVSFGVAPAIVTYQWGVARIAEYGPLWRRVGWLVCFFYAAAAALRLARFNREPPHRTNITSKDCRAPLRPRSSRPWFGSPAIKSISDCRD